MTIWTLSPPSSPHKIILAGRNNRPAGRKNMSIFKTIKGIFARKDPADVHKPWTFPPPVRNAPGSFQSAAPADDPARRNAPGSFQSAAPADDPARRNAPGSFQSAAPAAAADDPARRNAPGSFQSAAWAPPVNAFARHKVAFTGTLKSMPRRIAIEYVRAAGGKAFSTMPAGTTLLVVGENPGMDKMDKADLWIGQVRKITERQFLDMLNLKLATLDDLAALERQRA